MRAAICFLCLAIIGADSFPLRITSSEEGRVVTVVARPADGQLPATPTTEHESELTAAQGEAILTLRLADENGQLGAPILGEYRRVGAHLKFQPRYQLVHGYEYRATLYRANGKSVSLPYRVPKRQDLPSTVVERVFPSGHILPANHMKFYVYFSRPMRESRRVFDRIHLLNEDGSPVPDPWRRTELWTEDARRLTLWIHPGRIKTGVNLRQELGPVLQPDRHYSLQIDASVQDAQGQPLAKRFTKKFKTTNVDSERPQPGRWRLSLPQNATRQPLEVQFREPLDHALLQRFLEVRDSEGDGVAGRIEIGENETNWSFLPKVAWGNEDYRLIVDPLLEDLAGNTPNRIFDADLTAAVLPAPKLILEFRPLTTDR